ncbi:MAG: hypothetical protein KJ970_20775 [Candidatus Eisenbacteria bacterium]|uniref:Zinc-finger domain-containing protein n=1 Tax=Eiseniibacteriota bacterium TaxID=2212470 RepID=A0A948S0J2_UNCEI|nr:hypothetical protein [Candidatus Eisenbacteria bacterium]MBU1947190.1 hypothetical protein [Candidatus Eisenbacteria bacterium]MBU2693361.1 hypothetical protein [Candidatus Eisenbacteria bacterium]
MPEHLSDEEIIRLCLQTSEGDAPGREEARHLQSGCVDCGRRFAQIQTILESLAAGPLAEVPERLMARAREWIEDQERSFHKHAASHALKRRLAKELEVIRAALVMDGSPGSLLAGVRGTSSTTSRHLLFESPAGSVHVMIESAPEETSLIRGQFLPAGAAAPAAGAQAVLVEGQDQDAACLCPLSPAGEFIFRGVGGPDIHLAIEWAECQVVLDPIHFPHPADD